MPPGPQQPQDPQRPPSAWSGTALVVRGDVVLEEVSQGPAAGGDGPRCTPGLRSQAGSISKLVVSVVVLRLVEQRLLDLDVPVSRWLTGTPEGWAGITPRHLLGQTSGLGHWGDVPGLPGSLLVDPPARDDLVRRIIDAPLVADPGDAWRYSGPGFLVAALVVEAAAGAAYGEVADELVLRPAGMHATTSGRHPTDLAEVALGHRDGELLPLVEGFTHLPGTGDLWTTAGDLVRLSQALRAGVLLGERGAERLWTPYAVVPGAPAGGPVVPQAYGFGTFLGTVKGRQARINPGDNPGYQSLLAHLPDEDLDVVVLANDEVPGVDAALGSLTAV